MKPLDDLADLKEVQKTIVPLKKKILENQGKVALTLREIITRPLESHYDSGNLSCYLETGIVSGELICNKDCKSGHNSFEITDVMGFRLGHEIFYSYFSDFAIPVKKKLVNHGSFSIPLGFSIGDLKKAADDTLGFGSTEILSELNNIFYQGREDYPHLEKLDILVGEEEIRNFMKSSVPEKNINDYFALLQDGEIEKRIAKYDHCQRENIAEKLIQRMSRAYILGQEIRKISGKVEKITFSRHMEQDGSYVAPSDLETNTRYDDLKEAAKSCLSDIEMILAESEKINLKQLEDIDGKHIGFPAKIPAKDYLSFVLAETSTISSIINNLNAHLREEYAKVH